jgi:hypothetical protein
MGKLPHLPELVHTCRRPVGQEPFLKQRRAVVVRGGDQTWVLYILLVRISVNVQGVPHPRMRRLLDKAFSGCGPARNLTGPSLSSPSL